MGARVLIIEDNPANLELMTYLLGAFGHTVLAAEDGCRGVESAERNCPDLIVCDVQLPDVDGFKVARQLRGNPELNRTPLVAVTALAMVGDRDRVLAAGFDGYLTKPIDPETFVGQIEVYLLCRQHSPAQSGPAAPGVPEPGPTPEKHTIVVADNFAVNRELARSILVPSGFNVFTADSIAEGMHLAKKNSCDLILSDVCISGGTGYDFLHAILDDPELREVPFILITSTLMTDADRDKGLALGAARYLRRPIEPELLLSEINACLAKRKEQRACPQS